MDKAQLTKKQRWEVADRLADDRLPVLNAQLVDVVPSSTWYARYGKRILDVVLSGVCLIICLPINALIGVVTFFDVGRPIFFKQERVGKDGKPFVIVKFRNMRDTRDERGDLLPPSERVTRFGRFVRRTSLDELLNFWSVFKGDMSILGPRPLVPEYTHRYNKRHRMRLAVKPGLECPPRTRGQSIRTWNDQFENDVWYVENLSFKTDCIMLGNLIRFTFDRKNSSVRASAQRGAFMGYGVGGSAISLDEIPQSDIEELLSRGERNHET